MAVVGRGVTHLDEAVARWRGEGERMEGGGGKGCAERYLQCAGCEACHLSSNRKPVCGRN